jgi:DNA-nicking Smr family endonuclease
LDDGGNDEPFALPLDASIDLHAFAPRDIASVVEEYVRAAHEAGFTEVRLIHGRGKGVQRGIVQSVLEKDPLVESFSDAPESHLGATVAVLKKGPDPGQARV